MKTVKSKSGTYKYDYSQKSIAMCEKTAESLDKNYYQLKAEKKVKNWDEFMQILIISYIFALEEGASIEDLRDYERKFINQDVNQHFSEEEQTEYEAYMKSINDKVMKQRLEDES